MTGVKVLAASVFGAVIFDIAASAWEHVVHNVAIEIAVIAAGVTGFGVLWRKLNRRVIRPARVVLAKINVVYESVRELPVRQEEDRQWRQSVDQRLDDGSDRFQLIEGHLALLTSADKLEVSAALERVRRPPESEDVDT